MRAFWLFACGLAFASLAHAYLIKPLLQRKRKHVVAAVTREAEKIWRITLQPAAKRPFRFVAGQFVWIKFLRAFGRITEHPFSIASPPTQLPRLDFLVREAGDFTSQVGSLPAATPAFLDGPYGDFTLEARDGVGIMLIAGGVGIAPILSIARSLAERRDPRPVLLVYADRNESQLAARSELEMLQRDYDIDVRYVLAEPPQDWSGLRGRLGYENVAKCVPTEQADRWLYFVCGPPAMIDTVELALARLGVPLAQIVSERFRYGTGIVTPRERLTRAVIAGIVLTLVLGALAFTVR